MFLVPLPLPWFRLDDLPAFWGTPGPPMSPTYISSFLWSPEGPPQYGLIFSSTCLLSAGCPEATVCPHSSARLRGSAQPDPPAFPVLFPAGPGSPPKRLLPVCGAGSLSGPWLTPFPLLVCLGDPDPLSNGPLLGLHSTLCTQLHH